MSGIYRFIGGAAIALSGVLVGAYAPVGVIVALVVGYVREIKALPSVAWHVWRLPLLAHYRALEWPLGAMLVVLFASYVHW